MQKNQSTIILFAFIILLTGCSAFKNEPFVGGNKNKSDGYSDVSKDTANEKPSISSSSSEEGLEGVVYENDMPDDLDKSEEIPEKSKEEVIVPRTTFSVGQIEHPFDVFPQYRIAPGDVLDVLYQVRTWVKKDKFKIAVDHTIAVKFVHSPELNEEQIIRPDGNISLPYLGDVYVIGFTVAELRANLQSAYINILQNPEIYITVPEFQRGIKELKADLHTAPRGLSRLVTVRPDGYVTFPMVGDFLVADETVPNVSEELNAMYEEMLPGLHCDVFLEKHSGTVVYVVGEVKLPGVYKISKPITIVEAMALAGSYIPGAKLSNVIVARKHENEIVATRVNMKKVLALKTGSAFFYLQPDDIVYVPKTFIRRAAEVMRDIKDIVMFRGWGVSSNLSFSYDLHKDFKGQGDETGDIFSDIIQPQQ